MCQDEIAKILSQYKDRYNLAELARRMDMSYSSLARILNENDPYDLGITKLIRFIEAADNDFTLLDHIEARLGRTAMHIQIGEQAFDFHELSKLTKEMGEALTVVSEALADGRITRAEATNCIKEVLDVVQVAMGIIQVLKRIEANGSEMIDRPG